jgi:hypothetical protein
VTKTQATFGKASTDDQSSPADDPVPGDRTLTLDHDDATTRRHDDTTKPGSVLRRLPAGRWPAAGG